MPDDTRTRRLEWIRDGSNWLVGLAAGALILSGTYFFEQFERSPRWLYGMVFAWMMLAVSILAGVLTSFSAWKNLLPPVSAGEDEPPMKGWLTHGYTVMMWSFLLGYISLTMVMAANALRPGQPRTEPVKLEFTDDREYTIRISGERMAPTKPER